MNNLLYNYKYHDGQLVQTEEYAVMLSGETVTAKTLKHRTEFHRKDGKLSQKVDVYVNNGEETTGSFEEICQESCFLYQIWN